MRTIDIEEVLKRLMLHYELNNYSALARKLGITPRNMSMWRARKSVDWVKVFELDGLNLNYIVYGECLTKETITTKCEYNPQNANSHNELITELRRQISFLEKQIDKQRGEFLAEIRRLTPVIPRVNTVEIKNNRRSTQYGL